MKAGKARKDTVMLDAALRTKETAGQVAGLLLPALPARTEMLSGERFRHQLRVWAREGCGQSRLGTDASTGERKGSGHRTSRAQGRGRNLPGRRRGTTDDRCPRGKAEERAGRTAWPVLSRQSAQALGPAYRAVDANGGTARCGQAADLRAHLDA